MHNHAKQQKFPIQSEYFIGAHWGDDQTHSPTPHVDWSSLHLARNPASILLDVEVLLPALPWLEGVGVAWLRRLDTP